MQRLFVRGACILVAAIIGTLVLAAGCIVAVRASGKELYSVQSGSMAPAVRRGDGVVLSRTYSGLREGDIISFYAPHHDQVLVTHRIIEIDAGRDRIITKGDRSDSPDAPISQAQVVGKISLSVPFAGYVLNLFRSPIGLIVMVYLPAAVIIAGETRRLARHYGAGRYRLYGYRRFSLR